MGTLRYLAACSDLLRQHLSRLASGASQGAIAEWAGHCRWCEPMKEGFYQVRNILMHDDDDILYVSLMDVVAVRK